MVSLKKLSLKEIAWALVLLAGLAPAALKASLSDINNVIIIYQENWSFDSLYGKFPGANGLANSAATSTQIDLTGTAYGSPNSLVYGAGIPVWEPAVSKAVSGSASVTCYLPNSPYDLFQYMTPGAKTAGDPPHKYYTEQLQIDGGYMDKYVAWSSVSGLAMSYFDATNFPEGMLAQQYTICDNFFHGAFGGSFLNHLWLVSAQPAAVPVISGVPCAVDATGAYVAVTQVGQQSPASLPATAAGTIERAFTRDALYNVNTTAPFNMPHFGSTFYTAPLTITSIGDMMSNTGVAWKWYSGGWDAANYDTFTAAANLFQFHHQPFNYYAEMAVGSVSRTAHLADESHFFSDLYNGQLPAVSFVKPQGPDNEHPNYTGEMQGQEHVAMLVSAIQNSPYWAHSLIIITYDEHGGRWDHVAPPGSAHASAEIQAYVTANPARADIWGPGSRVPAILISPYVRKGYVDHTIYDTTSILALIENRFCGSARLATRDAAVNSLELSLTTAPQAAATPTPGGNSYRTQMGPVPQKKGQPVCIYYERPVSKSHLDIYNLAGQKAATLDFGSESSACWDSSSVAAGIYMIRASMNFADGSTKNVWNKVVLQP